MSQPIEEIPRLGAVTEENQASLIHHLSQLALESRDSRDQWAELANVNLQIYLWGEYPQPAADVLVVNEIQNAILQNVTIQTREPPRATLEPVETGDPGELYLMSQPTEALDPNMLAVMTQPTPATDEMGQPVADPMSDPANPQPAMNPPAIDPNDVVQVNDELVSEVEQQVFDRYWQRSGTDEKVVEIVRNTEIKGWLYALYQFDEETKRHRVRPLSVSQVYIDPTVESIQDATFAGVDLVLDADEAKKYYPDCAVQIDAVKHTGQPHRPDGITDLGQVDRSYNRPIVTLRVFWLRNSPCPMSEEQAVASGAVIQQEVVDEPAPIAEVSAEPAAESAELPEAPDSGMAASDPADDLRASERGELAGSMGAQPAQPRIAYFLPDTLEEVTPADAAWPTYLCVREVVVIESFVARDRECEHWDIPLIQNVNRPTPGEPWGIGEPMYLKNLQHSNNRILRAMVRLCEFYSNPAPIMPRSMFFRQLSGLC